MPRRSAPRKSSGRINRQTASLPPALAESVAERLYAWDRDEGTRRLFAPDSSLWTGRDESNWLGWLGIVEQQLQDLDPLRRLQEELVREGFTDLLLLGMGGSSLCPEVLKETFGAIPGHPELHVLDSTDPAQVRACEEGVAIERTLFIVSSKSGSTLEPNIFKDYFFDRVKTAVGTAETGRRFIAVTDPGSSLEREAKANGFRHIFPGVKNIGGRYSALSNFGLVPAAGMGLEVEGLLEEADLMLRACAPGVPAAKNPGVTLGTMLAVAALQGLDKLTLVTSPGVYDLGAWLEQLVAESTGKEGRGIIPVDRERVGPPDVYGGDRFFAYLRLDSAPDAEQDRAVAELERTGHAVVRIGIETPGDLAEEFIRWEIATAVAGAILGINPFDQPDVEASKVATRALTDAYERDGRFPDEAPFFEERGIALFADPANAETLKRTSAQPSLAAYVKAHVDRHTSGDYFGVLAYLNMNRAHEEQLQSIRHRVRDRRRVATCLGFGPRFLHSTGQAYKGGPNTGVFMQVTCRDAVDLPVPGRKYTFGIVKAAQARGDLQVLAERNRRLLRVHLNTDIVAGLRALDAAMAEALA
jgi:transaldolase/glucose-6-phosphate isomerase